MATRKRVKGKLSGLKADGTPNAHWEKFINRLNTYSDTPLQDWKTEHLLGHILKRHRDYLQMDFALSYSGPPTKCREIYCLQRAILALGIEDPKIIKQYIDWVFDTAIIPGKVILSSIAYFFTPNLIFSFKSELKKKNRITRATELPEDIKNVVSNLSLDVKTYGDLAFAKVAIEDDPKNTDLDIYFRLFLDLKEAGFDDSILQVLEG